jgi:hypothetical protein
LVDNITVAELKTALEIVETFTTAYKKMLDFYMGTGQLNNLNVDVSWVQSQYVYLTANTTLTLINLPPAGQVVHLYIYNNSSSTITITIPATYISMGGSSISMTANSYAEMNIAYDTRASKFKISVLTPI